MINLNRIKCVKGIISLTMDMTADDDSYETRATVVQLLDTAWGILNREIWHETTGKVKSETLICA